MKNKQKTCKVRADILNQNLAVPIGNVYYGESKPLPYRWRKDVFQVFYNNKWEFAKSVDFDF